MFLKTTLFPTICSNFLFTRSLLRFFCFSCALSGCLIFRALLRLSSFPSLGFGCLVFPHFATSSWFSRVVFLRLARVSCFPTLVSEWAFFPALGSGRAFFPPRLVSVFFALDVYDSKYFLALYSLLGFSHWLIVFMIRFSDATNDLKHIIHPEFNYVDIRTAWGCKFLIRC